MEQNKNIKIKLTLPNDYFPLTKTPPDKLVKVIDNNGNEGFAYPTYYPFDVIKMRNDEKKPYGWRGTTIFYEDKKNHWDGGWMIKCIGLDSNIKSSIIGWKFIES